MAATALTVLFILSIVNVASPITVDELYDKEFKYVVIRVPYVFNLTEDSVSEQLALDTAKKIEDENYDGIAHKPKALNDTERFVTLRRKRENDDFEYVLELKEETYDAGRGVPEYKVIGPLSSEEFKKIKF